jgi:hypothetical protein
VSMATVVVTEVYEAEFDIGDLPSEALTFVLESAFNDNGSEFQPFMDGVYENQPKRTIIVTDVG